MARSTRTLWMTLALGLCVGTVCLALDESSIKVDPAVDFSDFRTFALREGRVECPRPELDNPLFLKRLGKAITAALIGKGLTQAAGRADLVVDYTVTGEDFGRAARPPMRGLGPHPVRFTEGTLVID